MSHVPGSSVSGVAIDWRQISDPPAAPGSIVFGRYLADVADGRLMAIVSKDGGLYHISVSFRGDTLRCPTWDELKDAKYRLVPEDCRMVIEFPRASADYVDISTTCLHLWEADDQ